MSQLWEFIEKKKRQNIIDPLITMDPYIRHAQISGREYNEGVQKLISFYCSRELPADECMKMLIKMRKAYNGWRGNK